MDISNCCKDKVTTRRYESPCGMLTLGSSDGRLCLCDWLAENHQTDADRRLRKLLNAETVEGTSEVIEKAVIQLDEFFAGQRRVFDVPLLPVGTHFQKTVWSELQKIPYGTTLSYREIAQRIGMPKAVRAVANANGANLLSIFIPCHRVVGSDRSLTGYRGGLAAKQVLLQLEGAVR